MSDMQRALDNAYLKDMENGEILNFGYIPEEISDTKAANYAQIDVPGRSEPIFGYINSGPREFSLHLKFIAGIGQTKFAASTEDETPANVALITDSPVSVLVKTRWLQSLMYPDYSKADYTLPPHKVLLSVGLLIKSVCIVPSVNVTYKSPYDQNLLPFIAEVDISLQEVNTIPFGFSDIRSFNNVNQQPITTPLLAMPGAMITPVLISPTPEVVAPKGAPNPTIPWGQLKLNTAGFPTIWNGQTFIGIVLGNIYSDPQGRRWIVKGDQSPSTWYLDLLPV
jgi:hypothetical protein